MTNCHGLKMLALDGKVRLTDVAKVVRKELEAKTRKKVVTKLNSKSTTELKDEN